MHRDATVRKHHETTMLGMKPLTCNLAMICIFRQKNEFVFGNVSGYPCGRFVRVGFFDDSICICSIYD
jgi:hypothetical protein